MATLWSKNETFCTIPIHDSVSYPVQCLPAFHFLDRTHSRSPHQIRIALPPVLHIFYYIRQYIWHSILCLMDCFLEIFIYLVAQLFLSTRNVFERSSIILLLRHVSLRNLLHADIFGPKLHFFRSKVILCTSMLSHFFF